MTADRLRVCFVCNEYPPGSHGGIGTLTQVLGRGLARAGHDVRVVGTYGTVGAERSELDQGVLVSRLSEGSAPLAWARARRAVWARVAAWARRGEIDIVEVPDWMGPAAWWPRLPVPVVVRANGSASFYAAELGERAAPVYFNLERASLRRADFWCSSSRYTANVTRRLFRLRDDAGAVLPNPVELPAPGERVERERAPHRVLFTGTLTAKKGVVSLIDAWPLVRAAVPAAELHLFGKDARTDAGESMRAHLEGRLGGSARGAGVTFHGHVDRPVLFEALDEAAVAVFPSRTEAFGIAVIEAMARGCPAIFSTRSAGPEVIRDGHDGLLVDPDDPAAIAGAIVRVLGDRELAARLGARGRERAYSWFSIDVQTGLNERFYERCLSEFHAGARVARGSGGSGGNGAGRSANGNEAGRSANGNGATGTSTLAGAAPATTATTTSSAPEPGVVAWRTRDGGAWRDAPPAPAADARRGITLALCTRGRAASVDRFLRSVAAQHRPPERIVVVDASADDATEHVVCGKAGPLAGSEIAYARVAAPLAGLTRQRNFALRWVHTDLVVFFDDDVVLRPGCIAEMERVFRDGADDVIGVGAYIENEHHRPSLVWRARALAGVAPSLRPGRYFPSGVSVPWSFMPPTERVVEGDWLRGCAMMWRADVLREVRFHEGFGGYANGEDLDVSLRMRARGRLLVAGGARALHLHDAAGRLDARQLARTAMLNGYDIHRRCLPRRRPWHAAWFLWACAVETLCQAAGVWRGSPRARWQSLRGCVDGLGGVLAMMVRGHGEAARPAGSV